MSDRNGTSPRSGRPATSPWTTDADRAESEVNARWLVDWYWDNPDDEPGLRLRTERLFAWQERRRAESFAVAMRRIQDVLDE